MRIVSTTFTLHQATKGSWLRWWPLGFRSLVFPPGNYELAFDGVRAKWRYLGPHFSVKGHHVEHTNSDGSGYSTPVGFQGPIEFAGDWHPSGHVIQPPTQWVSAQIQLYARMEGLAATGQVGPLLKHMIELVGD
jgi:hypothetical protein